MSGRAKDSKDFYKVEKKNACPKKIGQAFVC